MMLYLPYIIAIILFNFLSLLLLKQHFFKQYNESIKEYNMILESLNEIDEAEEEDKKENRKRKAKTSKKAQRKGNMRACNCGKCKECQNYTKKRAREELEEDEE